MRKSQQFVFVAIFLLLSTTLSFPARAKKEQKPATGKEMDKLIADWPDFSRWCAERTKKIENAENPAEIFATVNNNDLDAFLSRKGWEPDRFRYVTGVCSAGTWIAYLQSKNPEIAAEFDANIEEVNQNTEMPAEDKKQAIAALQEAKKVALGVNASNASITEEELTLVKPRLDKLLAIFSREQ
jgi:hypothetical protein